MGSREVMVMADAGPDPNEHRGQGIIEYGILLGTLALGVVLTLVAIGTQIRTVMTDTPPPQIGDR